MMKHVMIVLEQKVRRHPKLHTILPPTKEFKLEFLYLHPAAISFADLFYPGSLPCSNYLHRVAASLDLSLCLSVTVFELSS